MNILVVDSIQAGYGDIRILHGTSLAIDKGEITAIVGSNGAGKTTLLRTIAGLLPVTGGSISFAGQPIESLRAHERVRKGIVLVPEGRLVFHDMSVQENLQVGAINDLARNYMSESLAGVFDLFPRLKERRNQTAGTLSGGEQQMLALGRGLMARPQLLLLDEPTLGLAPAIARQIFDIIPELQNRGVTVLLSEQDVARTLRCAAKGFVLEHGRVTMSGNSASLLASPEMERAFFGSSGV